MEDYKFLAVSNQSINMIENIVIKQSKWRPEDLKLLFFGKDEQYDESQIHFSEATTIPELLVEIGVYKSKGESTRANRSGLIPRGWTEFWASKKRKIYIWNPQT